MENEKKSFKRSSSRKDEIKKPSLSSLDSLDSPNRPATYLSMMGGNSSNFSTASPPFNNNSGGGNQNYGSKFSYDQDSQRGGNNYQRSPYDRNFNRANSFQKNNNNQQQGGQRYDSPGGHKPPFRQQLPEGAVSLYIKANNVNEELLRSLFSANVSRAKILSIDVKNNFAFVNVDSKEAADEAIQELNGKTFQDSLFAVSLARPRKPAGQQQSFQRTPMTYNNIGNSSGGSNNSPRFERSNSGNNLPSMHSTPPKNYSSNHSSPFESQHETSNDSRHLINYDDV